MSTSLPVTVVTGFLGAGKTTLVNQWLTHTERGDIAVIVNEHGAVGIDGELLAARVRLLIEVTGGCVCCTTHAELVQALDLLATSVPTPRRILIETSGAASPAGVLRAVVAGGRSGRLNLDGVVTVVDVTRVDALLKHELALEQLGYADVVVLAHTDVCGGETVKSATDKLAAYNGAALFVEAARGEVIVPALPSLSELLALRGEALLAPRAVPRLQRVHDVYESVSLVLDGEVDGERFADFIESTVAPFAGRIFRIKGILAVAGVAPRMIVQGVTDSVEITFGDDWGIADRRCRLVVVGFGLAGDVLRTGFAACAVVPAV